MRDNAVQLIDMQLVGIAQLTALGTEAGQRECGGHIGANLLHAAREAIQLDDQ